MTIRLEYVLPAFSSSDPLSITRLYTLVTVTSLLIGKPFVAACVSFFTATILKEELQITLLSLKAGSVRKIKNKSNFHDKEENEERLEYWLRLSFISVAASIGSWIVFLLAASLQQQQQQQNNSSHNYHSTRTWLLGMIIEKSWSIALGYLLYKDVELELPRIKQEKSREEYVEFRVRIVQGRNLVGKDTSFFGRHASTSDPYVVVSKGGVLGNKILLGKTSIVHKTLNPVWPPHVLQKTILTKSLLFLKDDDDDYHSEMMECRIYDHDVLSADDPMGTVYIPITKLENAKTSQWLPVQKGEGHDFCHNATGELLVEVESVLIKQDDS